MAELTPLGLSVLGLLVERPMHAYEMYQLLLTRRANWLVKVRPGSLYHTVERLAGQELIHATGTDRSGNRPERTTYAIKDAGREALTRRVQKALEAPGYEYPVFPVALSEAHNLPVDDVLARLARRVDEVDKELTRLLATLDDRSAADVAEAYWFVADYLRVQLTAERDWLQTTINRIESKDLPWPHDKRN